MKGNLYFRCGYAKDAVGGAGGDIAYPYNFETLNYACADTQPLTIILDPLTDYNLNGQKLYVEGRKTIIGGVGTTIKNGELRIQGVSDVVLHHIRFRDSVGDCVTVKNSDLVHINQCTFDQKNSGSNKAGGTADGAVDVVGGSGRVTVANSKFLRCHKPHLIGWDEPGDENIRVTLYRNWYRANRRIPQVNRAWVHVRNCVHDWNDQCCASYAKGRVWVDRCYITSKEGRSPCGGVKSSGKDNGYIGFGGGTLYKNCSPYNYKSTKAKAAKAHWDTMPRLSKSWSSADKIRKAAGMQYK